MRFGSLFSGIGGLDLGLERAGMECAWQSELDSYCSQILAKHWPDVPNLGDVTKIEWKDVERVDLICGGYPCQPFSYAGKREGEADARHLWPAMLDAIRVLRPRFALLENVPGHLSLGFGRVLGDLAESGYDAEWDCIPAAAVGAPHRRDRVWIVAYPQGGGAGGESESNEDARLGSAGSGERFTGGDSVAVMAGTDPVGRYGWTGIFGSGGGGESTDRGWWTAEPDVGRVAHGIPRRMDRLKGLGNAVVPQVAEWIGRRIIDHARGASDSGGDRSSLGVEYPVSGSPGTQ